MAEDGKEEPKEEKKADEKAPEGKESTSEGEAPKASEVEPKAGDDKKVEAADKKEESEEVDKKEESVEAKAAEGTADVKEDSTAKEGEAKSTEENAEAKTEEDAGEVKEDEKATDKTEGATEESNKEAETPKPTPKKRGRPPKKSTTPGAKVDTPKAPSLAVVSEAEDKSTAKEKSSKKRKSVEAAPTTPASPAIVREGKRERKSADAFQPTDFVSNVDRSVTVIEGRGQPLEDLAVCRKSIEATSSDVILNTAHRLLFTHRGKPAKKDMKKNILKFSGFLTKKVDADEEKQDALDNEEEAKMGQKAYKLKVAELRNLCDFFGIDRTEAKDKDGLVDALLDFLGEPQEKFLKGGKKGTPKPKKAGRKSSKEVTDDEEDEDTEMEDVEDEEKKAAKGKGSAKKESKSTPKKEKSNGSAKKGSASTPSTPAGKLPSDDELRDWVGAYVKCYNMSKSTIKHAIQIASEKFDVDVAPLKPKLKQFLTEAL